MNIIKSIIIIAITKICQLAGAFIDGKGWRMGMGYLAETGLSIVFGEKRDNPSVIRKSVFNVVRHPIYLSEILLYLGLLMLSISPAAFVVLLMAIVFLHHISRFEERLLLTRFGEEYREYMQEVPMWIPRLRKR